jgi:hypothetical protein
MAHLVNSPPSLPRVARVAERGRMYPGIARDLYAAMALH